MNRSQFKLKKCVYTRGIQILVSWIIDLNLLLFAERIPGIV